MIKRLDKEPFVRICELAVQPDEDARYIFVGVVALLGESIITEAKFHLPIPFELAHLHNEIDEIADGYKAARKDFFTAALPVSGPIRLPGTGLRGRWATYG